MRRGAVATVVLLGLFLLSALTTPFCFGANVTYDHRGLVIGGRRRVLISGSIHYMRSTPQMWPDLIQKSKDGGLDVIQTFVFWNLHEPVRGQYDFEGRKDLVKFVKLIGEAGLLVHLRIGPYACAEWNYGGFPLWLHFIPGIVLRTDNEPFKAEMKRFTAKIVDMMKQENLYASQGGPIILSQIENEYRNVESAYGKSAKTYINWAASMATSLDTGVPWVMCQQSDAPNPIINTCNGFYCDQFTPNSNFIIGLRTGVDGSLRLGILCPIDLRKTLLSQQHVFTSLAELSRTITCIKVGLTLAALLGDLSLRQAMITMLQLTSMDF